MPRHSIVAMVVVIQLSVAPILSYAQEQPEMDPEAVQLMQKMSEYLVNLKQFSVRGEAGREEVLHSGQKLMRHYQFNVEVRRPNKLHWTQSNADKSRVMFYDGERMTLHEKNRNIYATSKAPPTIDEALDFAAEVLNISTSARDLIYEDVFEELMAEVYAGSYVGKDLIDGVLCEHLAFRSEDADWQIWIESGDKPLPRKFVITSRWLAASPNYSARFIEWDVDVKLPEKRFTFKPPEGARQIRFIAQPSAPAKKEPSS